MSSMGCLMGAFSWLMTLRVRYGKIAQDPDRKAKTLYFGIYSIITSVFVCAAFVLIMWGIIACFNAIGNSGLGELLLYVIIAILVLVELLLLAEIILGGLMGIVFQFKCNRRPIGYIALAVFILAVGGMIAGIILLFSYMGN